MTIATIDVRYVNQPGQGRKNGSIKGANNEFYTVDPTLLSQFEPGNTYEVQYSSFSYNGKPYRKVETVKLLQKSQSAPTQGSYRGPSNEDREHMFVTAMLKGFAQAGMTLSEENIVGAGQVLRRAHTRIWTNQTAAKTTAASPPPRNDMDDEIPF